MTCLLFGVDEVFGEDALLGRLEGMKDVIEQVTKRFKDPVRSPILKYFRENCVLGPAEPKN